MSQNQPPTVTMRLPKIQNFIAAKYFIYFFILPMTFSVSLICPVKAENLASPSKILSRYNEVVAEKLYQTGELPGNLELAIDHYQKALRYDDSLKDIEWKISRCYWNLASKEENQQLRAKILKSGIDFGEKAVKKDPKNSYAHTWFALNMGTNAIDQGMINTLSNKDTIKKDLEFALKMDPKNNNARIGLASWFFNVPELLGGDKTKAYSLINQAIDLEPNYTVPRLTKAKYLISEERFSEAYKILEDLIAIEYPKVRNVGVYNIMQGRRILEDLQKMGNLF